MIRLLPILFLFLLGLPALNAQTLPESRRTDWMHPGPLSSISYAKSVSLISYGADPKGVKTSDSALSAALKALKGAGEIFVPQGVYFFKQPIILPDSILVRGETGINGPLATFKLSPGNAKHGIMITGAESKLNIRLRTPLKQGQKWLILPQPHTLKAGDWIRLHAMDDSLLVNDSWAYGSTGQIVQITGVRKDSLILQKPLRRTYSDKRLPLIYKITPRRQVQLQCLRLERVDKTSSQSANVYFRYAVDCSISGIDSRLCNFSHVDIGLSARISVENSYFNEAHSFGSGGKAYGIALQSGSGDCFIHQNIFRRLRHSILLQSGVNGNVVAYNYSREPYWTETLLPSNAAGDLVLHGNYPYMNLFEGNVVQNIVIDNSHKINGPYNTFFRNRAELYGIFMNTNPASNDQNFIGNQVTNSSSIFVGQYTLTGKNHYEYGNWVRNKLQPASTGEPAEKSLFGYAFPEFYYEKNFFPPIQSQSVRSTGSLIEPHYRYTIKRFTLCGGLQLIPTGMQEELKEKVQLYPNPFERDFYIALPNTKQAHTIQVYNVQGTMVWEQGCTGGTCSINGEMWAKGLYLIQLKGKTEQTFRVWKQ